ncbi:hypothetical protein OAE97_01595 [Verrucomicrobia bacterium]|nr:hypothetical protein [Verrucomicrobiota bacterium]
MKLDVFNIKQKKDGSVSFEVDYDREFKKDFERKFKKRLTKKSLTTYILQAVEDQLEKERYGK